MRNFAPNYRSMNYVQMTILFITFAIAFVFGLIRAAIAMNGLHLMLLTQFKTAAIIGAIFGSFVSIFMILLDSDSL